MSQMMFVSFAHRVLPFRAVAGTRLAAALLALRVMLPTRAPAQAQPPGVSLSTRYVAGQKTALIVLPVQGSTGDSVATSLSRDFDYSDRFNVVSTSSAPAVNGPPN